MSTLFYIFYKMGRKRDDKYDVAYQLYLDGLSLTQVADEMNITRQCVFKAFKKRKFQLRGKNFRAVIIYDDKKFTLRNNGYYGLTTNNRITLHRYKWQKEIGEIPAGYDIHHKDEDKFNNEISNYECLKKSDHTRKHGFRNNQFTKIK